MACCLKTRAASMLKFNTGIGLRAKTASVNCRALRRCKAPKCEAVFEPIGLRLCTRPISTSDFSSFIDTNPPPRTMKRWARWDWSSDFPPVYLMYFWKGCCFPSPGGGIIDVVCFWRPSSTCWENMWILLLRTLWYTMLSFSIRSRIQLTKKSPKLIIWFVFESEGKWWMNLVREN